MKFKTKMLLQGYDGNTYNMAGTGGANTVTVAVTNNQAATNATNQSVTITGSIDNTSLTTAQLASHTHTGAMNNRDGSPGGPTRTTGSAAQGGEGYNPNSFAWGNFQFVGGSAGSGTGHNHSHTLSGTLTGNITTSLTGAVTASGTNTFSPYVVVQYIIKH